MTNIEENKKGKIYEKKAEKEAFKFQENFKEIGVDFYRERIEIKKKIKRKGDFK